MLADFAILEKLAAVDFTTRSVIIYAKRGHGAELNQIYRRDTNKILPSRLNAIVKFFMDELSAKFRLDTPRAARMRCRCRCTGSRDLDEI